MIKLYRKFRKKYLLNDVYEDKIAAIRDVFDADYYLHQNPDVAEAGLDPVAHYCEFGWKEGRDPTADFSAKSYLISNSDVADAEIDPFWHYIVAGNAEGRLLTAPEITIERTEAENRIAQEVEVIEDTFDADYYLHQNPDVAEAGLDPVAHYCEFGWKEGHDPNRSFSGSYYFDANPDVRDLKINPFWHYILTGKAEGRLAQRPGGHQVETLLQSLPLEEMVVAWGTEKTPERMLNADDLRECILAAARNIVKPLVISVGHDNYRKVSGGVQYCIQQEEEIATARGMLYLNLHPYHPLPRLVHCSETPDALVSALLGGEFLGVLPMSAVIDSVRMLTTDVAGIEVVVHHLLGHSPEQITEMVRVTGDTRCWFWIHDFFTLCTNYALQRNDVMFCGAPPQNSNACCLCLYGPERIGHLTRIAAFFEDLSVNVIAPSQFAADYWARHSKLSSKSLTVSEHMVIDWNKGGEQVNLGTTGNIVIAFVGHPVPHKGWSVFERIVQKNCREEKRFDFVYFGTSQIALDGVECIPVRVTAENPDAMIRALSKRGVDIVLHWASCAETFSFSTHEAMVAGACVLTNPQSGNVAATVRAYGLGAVLEDEADLEVFFHDGRIDVMVSEKRARQCRHSVVLSRSDMIFSALDQEHRP